MIDIPIEPSGDDLRTINQDVFSSLCTEQPGADSPVDQAVASCVLDVGEELIGTCDPYKSENSPANPGK